MEQYRSYVPSALAFALVGSVLFCSCAPTSAASDWETEKSITIEEEANCSAVSATSGGQLEWWKKQGIHLAAAGYNKCEDLEVGKGRLSCIKLVLQGIAAGFKLISPYAGEGLDRYINKKHCDGSAWEIPFSELTQVDPTFRNFTESFESQVRSHLRFADTAPSSNDIILSGASNPGGYIPEGRDARDLRFLLHRLRFHMVARGIDQSVSSNERLAMILGQATDVYDWLVGNEDTSELSDAFMRLSGPNGTCFKIEVPRTDLALLEEHGMACSYPIRMVKDVAVVSEKPIDMQEIIKSHQTPTSSIALGGGPK